MAPLQGLSKDSETIYFRSFWLEMQEDGFFGGGMADVSFSTALPHVERNESRR